MYHILTNHIKDRLSSMSAMPEKKKDLTYSGVKILTKTTGAHKLRIVRAL